MKTIIAKDYEELSRLASEIMISVVKSNPNAVLGLATGSTPLGLYENMVRDHVRNGTSYAAVRAVNLDEYVGLSPDNDQSYRYFMRKNLFDKIDINLDNTYIENGLAEEEEAECARYNRILAELPRDVQLLGIGANGHIAFNEPGTPFDSETHVVALTENTIEMNARFFACKDEVPRRAFTMGIKNITDAKKVLILACGASKANAVYGLVEGEVTEDLPASILQRHNDCILIADEEAAARLKGETK